MTDTLKIWRCENADGVGPWSFDGCREMFEKMEHPFKHNPCRHEAPTEDPAFARLVSSSDSFYEMLFSDGKRWDRNYYISCKRLDTFVEWFDQKYQRDLLDANGLRLVQYEVPKEFGIHGRMQSAFRKDKATPTGETRACNWR